MKFQGRRSLSLPKPPAFYSQTDQAQMRSSLEKAMRSIPVPSAGNAIDAGDPKYSLSGLGEDRDGARLNAALTDAVNGPKVLKLPAGRFIVNHGAPTSYYGKDDGSFVTFYFGMGLANHTGERISILGEPGKTTLVLPYGAIGGQTAHAAMGFVNLANGITLSGLTLECHGTTVGNGLWLAADDPQFGSGTMDGVILRDITTRSTFDAGIVVTNVTRGFADNIFIDGTVKSVHDKEGHGWIFDAYQELDVAESVQTATGPAQYWNIGLLRTRNIQGAGIISQGGADYTVQTLMDEWVQRFLNDRHTSGYYATRVGNGSKRAWYDMIVTRGRSRGVRFNSTGFAHFNTLIAHDLEERAIRWIGGEDTLANSVEPGQGFSFHQATIFESNKSLLAEAKIFLYASLRTPADIVSAGYATSGAAGIGGNLLTDLCTTDDGSPGVPTASDPGVNNWRLWNDVSGQPTWLSIGGYDPSLPLFIGGYVTVGGSPVGVTDAGDPPCSLRVVDAGGNAVACSLSASRVRDVSTPMAFYESGVRCSGNNQSAAANEPCMSVEGGTAHSVGDITLYTSTERIQNVVRAQETGNEVIRLLSINGERVRVVGNLTGPKVYVDSPDMMSINSFMVIPGKTGGMYWRAYEKEPYAQPTLKAVPDNAIVVAILVGGHGYVDGGVDFKDKSRLLIDAVDGNGGITAVHLGIKPRPSPIKFDGICLSQKPGGGGNLAIGGIFASGGVANMVTSQPVRIASDANESATGANVTFTVTGLRFPFDPVGIIKNLKASGAGPLIDKYGNMNGTSTSGGVAYLGYDAPLSLSSSSASDTTQTVTVHGDTVSGGVTTTGDTETVTLSGTTLVNTAKRFIKVTSCVLSGATAGKIQVGSTEAYSEALTGPNATSKSTTGTFYQVNSVAVSGATAGNVSVGTDGKMSQSKQTNSHAGAGSEGGAGVIVQYTRTLSNQNGAILADQGGSILIGAENNGVETHVFDANANGVITTHRSFTVANLLAGTPSPSPAGQVVCCSNGSTNKRLAISDGANWRFPDGAVVS